MGVFLISIVFVYGSEIISALTSFIVAGYVPMTDFAIPPIAMLIIWAIISPLAIVFSKLSRKWFWSLLELAGNVHQRQLNRHVRWHIPLASLRLLLTAICLHLIDQSGKTKQLTTEKAPQQLRRFIALPA